MKLVVYRESDIQLGFEFQPTWTLENRSAAFLSATSFDPATGYSYFFHQLESTFASNTTRYATHSRAM